ncbi:Palmitoyltransferase PFA3 [Ceratocystis fimbriata CBS 114723]|uniref:Palmitoyltransferase n=1 Tax=Ceratocystis fimbriata CBS 114723 TaxID=1035309 RepID=A0A2C5WYP0_9PEZI|nr:Palmitoyltransferase PFA3 [Ceratocystis fimbriata CBS 114723]
MAPRRWARRLERTCCRFVTSIPLALVYGLTTWALWVILSIGSNPPPDSWIDSCSSIFGVFLYLMLNWSYTTAVFTDPGSTTRSNGDYSAIEAPPHSTSFTVKSNGEIRYCKKCQMRKPDRAHHCSTCRRCVLKMDHHCPWLATCIGLRNHKAFLLFLIYTTVFSIYACAVSSTWTYVEIMGDMDTLDSLVPVNYIILAVMAGIIGIVIGAFTSWHIALAARGQTTIECLEKTRYSSLRDQIYNYHSERRPGGRFSQPSYGQQIIDMHANAIPGVTRPEEGEDERASTPPVTGLDGQRPAYLSYSEMEQRQSQKRYQEYLDEEDSRKLPNAFDLGWKRNLRHLFGPVPLMWFFPICNTIGNGWSWDPNPNWINERERLRVERENQLRREVEAGWGSEDPSFMHSSGGLNISTPPSSSATRNYLSGPVNHHDNVARGSGMTLGHANKARRPMSKADRILGRDPDHSKAVSPTLSTTAKKPLASGILGSRRWESSAASGLLRKTSPASSTTGSASLARAGSVSPFHATLQGPQSGTTSQAESSDDDID